MWRKLAHSILRLGGWTLVGDIPAERRAVLIAAPHTSNWDGFWLIVCKVAMGIRLRFFAKHTLFWWPLGSILRKLGAIPIERSRSGANVKKLVAIFNANDDMYLALAPEGTRNWRPYWRSGFYRIAEAAQVPVIMAFIDYGKRRAGIGPRVDTSGGIEATMAQIRAFYETCTPARPEKMGPIRLRDMAPQDSSSAAPATGSRVS